MSMQRVAVIAHRFKGFGGIQTCFIELVGALNMEGIVPEIVWDEPQNWEALGSPSLRTSFAQAELRLSSSNLRRLPRGLSSRLEHRVRAMAPNQLRGYDFIYSFEPGVPMPEGVPNLCYTCGPPFVHLPEPERNPEDETLRRRCRGALARWTRPTLTLDRNSRYVTLSNWIAELFEQQHGKRLPVIWPPARTRALECSKGSRAGFLFLSRLTRLKRVAEMLELAAAFPEEVVTVAGGCPQPRLLSELRAEASARALRNVEIVVSPTEEEVAALLTARKYFVFPVPWEHFGIVTVEAIFAGLLPLVHDSGGQREIVPEEDLRFPDRAGLLECAGRALKMTEEERGQRIARLQENTRRGTATAYREAMLAPLRVSVPMLRRDGAAASPL